MLFYDILDSKPRGMAYGMVFGWVFTEIGIPSDV